MKIDTSAYPLLFAENSVLHEEKTREQVNEIFSTIYFYLNVSFNIAIKKMRVNSAINA
jgi:hypothetical protein